MVSDREEAKGPVGRYDYSTMTTTVQANEELASCP